MRVRLTMPSRLVPGYCHTCHSNHLRHAGFHWAGEGNRTGVMRVIVGTTDRSEVSQGLGRRTGGREVEITADGASLVLAGDFDGRSTWEVRNAIYEHLEGHDEDVVVD